VVNQRGSAVGLSYRRDFFLVERDVMRVLSYRNVLLLAVIAMELLRSPAPAAPFINLDFEQATIAPGTPPGFVNASAAFPGWTANIRDVPQAQVLFNDFGLGGPVVALYDVPSLGLGLPVFQGRFSAAVGGDVFAGTRASLSQVGDVPTGSRSLRFLADRITPPVVMVDSNVLPLVLLVAGPVSTPSVFGVDIEAFSGQAIELQFFNPTPPNGIIGGLDAIEFSALPVPEPSGATSFALLVLFTLLNRFVCRLPLAKEGRHVCKVPKFAPSTFPPRVNCAHGAP
jgi:hypothetical protein